MPKFLYEINPKGLQENFIGLCNENKLELFEWRDYDITIIVIIHWVWVNRYKDILVYFGIKWGSVIMSNYRVGLLGPRYSVLAALKTCLEVIDTEQNHLSTFIRIGTAGAG